MKITFLNTNLNFQSKNKEVFYRGLYFKRTKTDLYTTCRQATENAVVEEINNYNNRVTDNYKIQLISIIKFEEE